MTFIQQNFNLNLIDEAEKLCFLELYLIATLSLKKYIEKKKKENEIVCRNNAP